MTLSLLGFPAVILSSPPGNMELIFLKIFLWAGGILLCIATTTSYLGMLLSKKKSQTAMKAALGAKNVASKWRSTPPNQQKPGEESGSDGLLGSGGGDGSSPGSGNENTPSDVGEEYSDEETVNNDSAPEPENPEDSGTPSQEDVTGTSDDTGDESGSDSTDSKTYGYDPSETGTGSDTTGDSESQSEPWSSSSSDKDTEDKRTTGDTTSTTSDTGSGGTSSKHASGSGSDSTSTGSLVEERKGEGDDNVEKINEERAEEIASKYVNDVKNGDAPDVSDKRRTSGEVNDTSDITLSDARAAAHEYAGDELPGEYEDIEAEPGEKAVGSKVQDLIGDERSGDFTRGGGDPFDESSRSNAEFTNRTGDDFEVGDYVDDVGSNAGGTGEPDTGSYEDFMEATGGSEIAEEMYENPDAYDADEGWTENPEINEDAAAALAENISEKLDSSLTPEQRYADGMAEARRQINNDGDDLAEYDIANPASEAVGRKLSDNHRAEQGNNSEISDYEFAGSTDSSLSSSQTNTATDSQSSNSRDSTRFDDVTENDGRDVFSEDIGGSEVAEELYANPEDYNRSTQGDAEWGESGWSDSDPPQLNKEKVEELADEVKDMDGVNDLLDANQAAYNKIIDDGAGRTKPAVASPASEAVTDTLADEDGNGFNRAASKSEKEYELVDGDDSAESPDSQPDVDPESVRDESDSVTSEYDEITEQSMDNESE